MHMTETKENHSFLTRAKLSNKTLTRPKTSRLHSQREAKRGLHFITSFGDLISKIQQFAGQDSPTALLSTLSQPFQGERGFRTLRQWAPWHASCISWYTKVWSQMAAQCCPRKLPPERETTSPDQCCPVTSKNETFNVVFVHLEGRCTLDSCPVTDVADPIKAFWAARPPHVSQIRRKATVRQRRPVRPSCAKPHMAHALIVSTGKQCPKFSMSVRTVGSFLT